MRSMTSLEHTPADEPRPDEHGQTTQDAASESAALRQAIERIMSDDPMRGPIDEDERRERVAALRREIQDGAYMSEQKISDVVDRLMKKWKL
jgi:anti-sigma28 factor (negative regulator of flagellin synthesis)